jgi:hypothetical protein
VTFVVLKKIAIVLFKTINTTNRGCIAESFLETVHIHLTCKHKETILLNIPEVWPGCLITSAWSLVVLLPSQTRFSCGRFFFLGRKQHRRHHVFPNTPLLFARLLLLAATQVFPPPHLAGMKMKLFPKRNGHRRGCVIVPVFQIEFDRQQHEKSAGRWFSFQLWPQRGENKDQIPCTTNHNPHHPFDLLPRSCHRSNDLLRTQFSIQWPILNRVQCLGCRW